MPPERSVPPPGFADASVVTPAFNAQATIARTLASIAVQTLRPREVIVVDDGSTDGTIAAAEAFAPEMRGIALKILRQKNLGAGVARNRAIDAATGTWLAFLDADDEWLPTKIERCMAELNGRPADMVVHDYIRVENGNERAVNCARHCPPGADPFVAQLVYGFISSTTVVVRRARVQHVGGFDPGLRSGQDYELWLALLASPGFRMLMMPEALSRYHITPGGISSRVRQRRDAALAILLRHWRALRGRVKFPMGVAALRILIIHAQAAATHLRQNRPLAALMNILETPRSLLYLGAPPPAPRIDGLKTLND